MFEFAVVVIIVSVLALFLMSRLWALQVDAERVVMENMVGTLKSALGIKVASYIAKGDMAGLQSLQRSNPIKLLSEPPKDYVGEIDGADAAIEGGKWYFDTRAGRLVYRVRNSGHFRSGAGPQAQFGVELVYEDGNGNGMFDRGIDSIAGLRLATKEPYKWDLP